MESEYLFNSLLVFQEYINEIGYKPVFLFKYCPSRSSVVCQWLSYQPLLFIFEFCYIVGFLNFCVNV